MSEIEYRIAQVRCNSAGEWKLRVFGTDVYVSVYRYRDPELEPFPGNALGHRLVELGWMPDKRHLFQTDGKSPVQRVMETALAGWTRSEEERYVWTIPCYRETVR
jgi:hypothetical protein